MKPVKNPASLKTSVLSSYFPTLVIFLFQGLTDFVERVCLAHHSLGALNANMYAYSLLCAFQIPLMIFVYTLHLFLGSNCAFQIGNRIWQFIWISVLCMPFVGFLSLTLQSTLFQGTTILAQGYFNVLVLGSFLLPTVSILSSFFNALNKKGLILMSAVISSLIGIILLLLLVPRFGILGAAYSNLMTKALLCSFLFICFLAPTYRTLCHTHQWKIDWISIWRALRAYNPQFLSSLFVFLSRALIAFYMAKKGEGYLSIFSIGATLTFFATIFNRGIIYYSKRIFPTHLNPRQDFKACFLSSSSFCILLAIPLLLFPKATLSTLFPPFYPNPELVISFFWIWVYICLDSFRSVIRCFTLNLSDKQHYAKLKLFANVFTLLQTYYFIFHLNYSPSIFWIILCIEGFILLLFSIIRAMIDRSTTSSIVCHKK